MRGGRKVVTVCGVRKAGWRSFRQIPHFVRNDGEASVNDSEASVNDKGRKQNCYVEVYGKIFQMDVDALERHTRGCSNQYPARLPAGRD